MKKIFLLSVLLSGLFSGAVYAMGNGSESTTLTALWVTALSVAVLHTLAGPDHYLPFIAIAKSRGYGLKKTLVWTFVCGLGHIGSALLIALVFIYFSHRLSEARFGWIEDNRADLAAYTMIGLGAAYLLWALKHRLSKHHKKDDAVQKDTKEKNLTVWVVFIIFVLGPCEALLPILTASSVLGVPAVVSSTLIFSVATIATMMLAVTAGMLGLSVFRFQKLEGWAHELAGATILICGLLIICGF